MAAKFQIWSETPIAYGQKDVRLIGEYNSYADACMATEKYHAGTWETLTIKKIYE